MKIESFCYVGLQPQNESENILCCWLEQKIIIFLVILNNYLTKPLLKKKKKKEAKMGKNLYFLGQLETKIGKYTQNLKFSKKLSGKEICLNKNCHLKEKKNVNN